MDEWMDGWIDGWMDGWMDRQTDGWMDGWMDGSVGGWMNEVCAWLQASRGNFVQTKIVFFKSLPSQYSVCIRSVQGRCNFTQTII